MYKKPEVIDLSSQKKSFVSNKNKLNVSHSSENDNDFVSQPTFEPSPSEKSFLHLEILLVLFPSYI